MLSTLTRQGFILLVSVLLACHRCLLNLFQILAKPKKFFLSSFHVSPHNSGDWPSTKGTTQPPIPATVAFILADVQAARTPIEKLANAITWCIEGGATERVLVYHPQGLSQRQAEQLHFRLPVGTSLQHGFGNAKAAAHPADSGTAAQQQQQVSAQLASSRSCVPAIWLLNGADAIKPLTDAAAAGMHNSDRLKPDAAADHVEMAASSLLKHLLRCGGPGVAYEPNPVLVCGAAFTTAGFPPWLLRLSELYHLRPLHSLTKADVKYALQQFSRVEQRFGT